MATKHHQKRGKGPPNPIRPAKLKIRLVYPPDKVVPFAEITDRPVKNISYSLVIDGRKVVGKNNNKTGPDGVLEADVPANAKSGMLTLHMAKEKDKKKAQFWRIQLVIGGLEDPATIKGQQARLNNLGLFASKKPSDDTGEQFRRAQLRFTTLYGPPGAFPGVGKMEDTHGS